MLGRIWWEGLQMNFAVDWIGVCNNPLKPILPMLDTKIHIIIDDVVSFPNLLVPICRSVGRYHHFEQRQLRGTCEVWITR